jgi:uncharacterized membrane protein
MCGERAQRILMAIVLLVSLYFMSIGSVIGLVLQGFVVVMILIWAITNFCPSIWVFDKIFGKCEWNK